MRTALIVPQVPHGLPIPRRDPQQSAPGSMRFTAEPSSPGMIVLPPAGGGSYGGPPTPQGTSSNAKDHTTPHTPRAHGGTLQVPPQAAPAFEAPEGRQGTDVTALRAEVDMLQAQLKSVFDMLQDQGHALAMEAQERCQLAKLLQAEREERVRDVQELKEVLESERSARARERRELADALQGEVEARTSDVRELAKSLQSECNARAGEVQQLAKVFQTERETRIQEAEDLADTLRSEIVSSGDAGQRRANSSGDATPTTAARRLETAELAQRLNELTHFVMAERESHARVLEEWRRSQKTGGDPSHAKA